MNAHQAIEQSIQLSLMVLKSYVGDLSDAELLSRPGSGCNHVAWQLGHLIASCSKFCETQAPGSGIALPDGFAANHAKENSNSQDPQQFCTRQRYLELLEQSHAALAAAAKRLSPEDLDAPAPAEWQSICPTIGAMFVLMANHGLMHAGQFVPVRRALGKPIVI